MRISQYDIDFKVVHVIKLKLAFMEWFLYNLVILIKLYNIWYQNLDEALLLPRNQVTFLFVYFNKNVNNECVETRSFFIFASNSRSKQNEKIPEHPFVDIGK